MADRDSIIAALMGMSPADLANGFSNGARSFADQAKWQMGAFGNAPQPAPYDGGPNYPATDDANAYVRNNWPSSGTNVFQPPKAETFYTPWGADPPPGGRSPNDGEIMRGAPSIYRLRELLENLKRR